LTRIASSRLILLGLTSVEVWLKAVLLRAVDRARPQSRSRIRKDRLTSVSAAAKPKD
jgi:hypothetical protein